MKEVEISIKGLVFFVVKRWKSIILAMFIGAIVLCGLQMVRSMGRIQSVQNVASPGESLTVSEKEYVESLYNYLNELRALNETRRDSFIMSLNPESVVKNELTYMVSVDDSNNMEGVEQAYSNYLTGAEFNGYISDKVGMDNNDIADTVTITFERTRPTATSAVIKIVFVSDDKSHSDELANAIKSFMSEKNTELIQKGYGHDLTEIGNSSYQESDIEIQNRQLQYLQEIQSRNKTILDTENIITGAQKEYYMSLANASDADGVTDDAVEVAHQAVLRPSGKYIVIGLIIGAFVMCGIYSLIYIFANRLDEDDNIEELFGIYHMGTITGKEYGKVIYKLQHLGKRSFDFDESIRLVSTKIKMAVRKSGVSKIGILTCGINKNDDKAVRTIIEALTKEGIDAVLIDAPIYNPASAEKLSEVEAAVLLEKAGFTYRSEIWQEMDMIKKLGIKAEGLVVVE